MKRRAVILVYRKQFPHTFSIEFIFDQLFNQLSKLRIISKKVLPNFSNSFPARLINLLSLLQYSNNIIHVVGDVHYAILGAWFCKRILTIHDLAFMHQNKGVKKSILKYFYIILPVKFSHQIVVVSEATKVDLLQYVKVDQDKIKVIPDFISEDFYPNQNLTFNKACPQLLQIGTAFNKNIERLAAALVGINCVLIIIGKINQAQLETLNKYQINFENKVDLAEKDIVAIYQNSDLLTFFSTIEGFGMPILEAQTIGLPVLTSNCSAMPEVAGDGAFFADPFDIFSIRNCILQAINNPELRAAKIANGFKNVKRFSAKGTIQQHNLLYDSLN